MHLRPAFIACVLTGAAACGAPTAPEPPSDPALEPAPAPVTPEPPAAHPDLTSASMTWTTIDLPDAGSPLRSLEIDLGVQGDLLDRQNLSGGRVACRAGDELVVGAVTLQTDGETKAAAREFLGSREEHSPCQLDVPVSQPLFSVCLADGATTVGPCEADLSPPAAESADRVYALGASWFPDDEDATHLQVSYKLRLAQPHQSLRGRVVTRATCGDQPDQTEQSEQFLGSQFGARAGESWFVAASLYLPGNYADPCTVEVEMKRDEITRNLGAWCVHGGRSAEGACGAP